MKKISILFVVLVVAIISCKKTPSVNQQQVVIESEEINVDSIGVNVNIECIYDYPTVLKKAYLYYGVGVDETAMDTMEMQIVQDTLRAELIGLNDSTIYYYYYEFFNGFNSMRTGQKSFETN